MTGPGDGPVRTLPPADAWVDLYGDVLFRYALARVADEDAARDLVQDTLVAAVRARGAFGGRSSPRTWLVGILKHKIADLFRRRAREAPPDEADPEQDLFDTGGRWRTPPGRWRTDPSELASRRQFWQILGRCLSELPSRQAGAFALRELEGYDTAQLCQELGVTPTNAWVLLHRARLGLRRCLEAGGFGNPAEEDDP